MSLSLDTLRHLHEVMLLIRRSEERLGRLFADGEIPGFLHLSLGQEAVPAGVCIALGPTDTIASTHRGHGHALAKGMDLNGFFAEIMGKASGLCQGRGGSIHVAQMSIGMLGANGIVGGSLSLALGSAWAHQIRADGAIAVAFFGDGALAEGAMHECLNLAALWGLPIMFVCENNGWSEFSPQSAQLATTPRQLAQAYNMQYETADGVDVATVAIKSRWCVDKVRSGSGPVLFECLTQRWQGHYEGDSQKYRDVANLALARSLDPLIVSSASLREHGVTAGELDRMDRQALARVDAAVVAAQGSGEPDFKNALTGVYAVEESNHG